MFRVCGSCKLRILCAHFLSIRKARLRPLIKWAKKRNLETKPGKIIPWVFYMTCNKHCKYFWNSFRKECSSFSTPAIAPSYQWLNYNTTAGETSTCVLTPMPTQELTLLCILCIPNPMNITHLHDWLIWIFIRFIFIYGCWWNRDSKRVVHMVCPAMYSVHHR